MAKLTGLIGRAHKQIYVNFIRSPDDAYALGASKAVHLVASAKSYSEGYDVKDAGGTNWHAINLVAVGKRAARDRIALDLPREKSDFDKIARDIIAALEPGAQATDDPWHLAVIGEAYLALGQFEPAAKYMALYAKHPQVDAFALNGTIRQLEEVWQLQAGLTGAGAVLAGLKAVMAEKPSGFVNLRPSERRALSSEESVQYSEQFETKTPGSDQVSYATIRKIASCSNSVFAIQKPDGDGWKNHGTAFLVDGAAFLNSPEPGNRYLLTNSHVMWDTKSGDAKGYRRHAEAVEYKEIRLVSESEEFDGRKEVYRCARVIWQSPCDRHDAVLLQLDRPIASGNARPLEIAGPDDSLTVFDGVNPGTPVIVIGHAGGGGLAIGYKGIDPGEQSRPCRYGE